jgi:hypothetical protein
MFESIFKTNIIIEQPVSKILSLMMHTKQLVELVEVDTPFKDFACLLGREVDVHHLPN